ncbi:MAG: hypothetical protein QOH99_1662, partial [Frankiaceae bacterium]|nr:hypothetical protein [Frankiaceae bacterium]
MLTEDRARELLAAAAKSIAVSAPPATADIRRQAARPRRRAAVGAAAVAASVAALLAGTLALRPSSPRPDSPATRATATVPPITTATGSSSPPAPPTTQASPVTPAMTFSLPPYPIVVGEKVDGVNVNRPGCLVGSPFSSQIAPSAVRAADGTTFVELWCPEAPPADATPPGVMILLHVAADGTTSEAVPGADSFALSGNGRLATVTDGPYVPNVVRAGRIEVRATARAAPVTWWDKKGNHIIVGWAGSELVAYDQSEGEQLEAFVYDRPGHRRSLGVGEFVMAISPDGTRVVVSGNVDSPRPDQTDLIDVATGKILDTMPVAMSYGGAWIGDTLVARTNDGTVGFVRIAGDQFGAVTKTAMPPFGAYGLGERPFAAEPDGSVLIPARTTIDAVGDTVYVTCTIAGVCERSGLV